LQAYRAIVDLAPVVAISLFQSCRSAFHPKALRARLLRGPPLKAAPIGLGQSTTFTVSLKGITETQAARHSAHDHPLSRAEPSGPQFLYGDCTVRLPRTIGNTAKACSKKVKISKACRYLVIPPQFGYRGQGYEKRHPSSHHLALSSPITPASSWLQPLHVGGDSADDKDQPRRQPEVERLYRTYREQLFRFLWQVRPWFNTAMAVTAGTTKLTEPYEMLAFSTKEQT
jgi:hypothetical protein